MMDLFSGTLNAPDFIREGERVYIRPPLLSDWSSWSVLREKSRAFLTPWEPAWADDSLSRFTWNRRLKRQYDAWKNDQFYSFLTFRCNDNALVGGLSLSNIRRGGSQSALLGYWVGEEYARQGYTLEAVCLTLDYSFDPAGGGFHRIEAGCLPSNNRSAGLLRKAGFKEEGLLREYLKINGDWKDHLFFSVLESEWNDIRARLK